VTLIKDSPEGCINRVWRMGNVPVFCYTNWKIG